MLTSSKETNERNKFLDGVTNLFLGYVITFIVIIVYSMLITFTSTTDKYIMFVVLVTTLISTVYVGFQFAKMAESRGILWGILGGGCYSAVFVGFGFFITDTVTFDSRTIFVLLFSLVAGAIGGIIGINSKK